jgi:hypothetical protein
LFLHSVWSLLCCAQGTIFNEVHDDLYTGVCGLWSWFIRLQAQDAYSGLLIWCSRVDILHRVSHRHVKYSTSLLLCRLNKSEVPHEQISCPMP